MSHYRTEFQADHRFFDGSLCYIPVLQSLHSQLYGFDGWKTSHWERDEALGNHHYDLIITNN